MTKTKELSGLANRDGWGAGVVANNADGIGGGCRCSLVLKNKRCYWLTSKVAVNANQINTAAVLVKRALGMSLRMLFIVVYVMTDQPLTDGQHRG